MYTVADPGFSWGGGRQLPKWDYFFNFLLKTAWKWKNLGPPGGGARPWRPPLDRHGTDKEYNLYMKTKYVGFFVFVFGHPKQDFVYNLPRSLSAFSKDE